MTFLSTCCCGSTKSPPPPPTGCQDVCCQSCFSGSRINDWSGNPIDLNDDLILYQGVAIETDGKSTTPTNYNLENSSATLKLQYKKMGSYWVWWHPSYICNYTTNIPECESTEFTRLNQVDPSLGDSGGGPEYNLHFGRTLEGDVCSHTLIPNRDASPPDADSEDSFSTNQLYYGGAGLEKGFRAFFNTIKGVAYGEDPFIFRYPTETVFAGVINLNSNSGPSVESGYPCSTAGEDECCYTVSTFRQKYVSGTPEAIAKNEYCNRMGISPYRRRILREHYPWAFQIFAYNKGLDWPFINNINYFEQNQSETSASGKQISGSAFSTPLRLQCLGFIQCEHHWGLGEAGACNNAYEDANFPLSLLIPRRFIYGCSAIPFFEFDLHEFAKDYGAIDVSNVITNMRAFTAIFPNPTGNFGIYGQQPYPDQNNTNAVRPILGLMAGQKFVNITAKDWRQEAVEELIIAESYYREALGITGANYDLFAAMMLPRPIPLTGTVEDLRNLSDAQKTETIGKIFGTPLGPIRKRHRALSVPGYFGDDPVPVATDVNVFMPYDVLSGTYEFLFQNENGDPVEELRQIQAMTYANVFAPIDEIDLKGSYPNETAEQRNLRKLSLIAKLSQITYTYMLMLPGKWDFSAWGPGLAGPGSPPQDNWFFRKYGYVQDPGNGEFPSFARVLAHSQINKCITDNPNEGFLDFAWNPTTNCLFGDCRVVPTGPPVPGIAIDPYCGRTTYSETPDILFAAHTYPVKGTSPPQDAECPNVPDNRYPIIQSYGKAELSFVRFQSRGMTWDASVIPHRVISRTSEEIEEYKTKNLGVRLTKTFENCTICYSQACCAQGQDFPCPSPYPDKFSAFNAKCSGVPRHRMPSEGGAAVSGCNGLVLESDGANSIVYDNEIDSISYDFNWYGPIAFRDQNPYSFLSTDQVFTIPGVTIQNLPDCFGYDFCDSFNRTVNNSLNSLSNEGITWIFGLPPNRYWEIPGATGGNAQYPYNLPYSDFVGMFTQECCELMENCPECKLGNNFAEDCAYKAARWCRCPKYPEQGISAWAANGPITNNDPNNFGPWNQGLFGGVSGIVLGYGYSRSADYDFKRWDRDPATGNILSLPLVGNINSDQDPRSILEFDADYELFEINKAGSNSGRTWGICAPMNSSGKIMFGSDNQFDCSKIMFNITEQQLRSIGFVNDDMINFYKGSFCGCEGLIVDENSSSGYESSNFNGNCYNSDNELGNCNDPVDYRQGVAGGQGWTLGNYKSAVVNNPQTPHFAICRYIANSLCGGLDIFGQGVAKFRDIEAPCHLKSSLWNGVELPSTPLDQTGLTGVTCYDTRDYLFSGFCYVAPNTYEEPGSGNIITCQDNSVFPGDFPNSCNELSSGSPLDPESDCCVECLNSVPPGVFVPNFDCAGDCNVLDGDIFVFDTPEEQQSSTDWSGSVQFANWARSLGLIGCWKKKT